MADERGVTPTPIFEAVAHSPMSVSSYSAMHNDTVLSCPACWSWQLHYYDEVIASWPGTTKAFEDVVEQILREHVAYECDHLRLFHALAKSRGLG